MKRAIPPPVLFLAIPMTVRIMETIIKGPQIIAPSGPNTTIAVLPVAMQIQPGFKEYRG